MFHDEMPPTAYPPVQEPVPVEEPAPPIWQRRDILLGVAFLLGGYFLLLLGFIIVGVVFDLELLEEQFTYSTAIMLIAFEGWIGITVLILARMRRISWHDLGFRRPVGRWVLPLTVVGAYASLAVYAVVVTVIDELTGSDLSDLLEGNPLPTGDYDILMWVLLGIGVVAIAPVAEELFFRGLLFKALDSMWPTFLAMVVSGAAFSLLHLNPSVLIPFTLIGIIFAWSFRRANSLWIPIGAHAIVNGMSFILTVMGVEG